MRTHLTSFILSQFFGLYILVVALLMFIRAHQYRLLAQKMKPDNGMILLGGLMGLLIGLFLVGVHNYWVFEPIVTITMTCWMVLILSILWLLTPERMVILTKKLCSGSGYYVLASGMMITGLWFLGRGIYLYATHQNSFLFMIG